MGKWLRAACWVLTFWFLAYNLYTWGGLAVTPTIGKQLREQSSLQSPIAASYLFLGRHAVASTASRTRRAPVRARAVPGAGRGHREQPPADPDPVPGRAIGRRDGSPTTAPPSCWC